MFILGLGGSGHDFSACICNDKQVIGYIEDERITRLKHSFFLGNENTISKMSSVFYLCDKFGISLSDIKIIVKNNLLMDIFYSKFIPERNIFSIGHHYAHACSAYYPSEFSESAILVVDGAGDPFDEDHSETISFWYGNGDYIENLYTHTGKVLSKDIYIDYSMPYENSIGGLYRVVTKLIGFGLFDEGKTMGLAPYGTDRYYKKMRSLVEFVDNGSVNISSGSYKHIIEMGKKIHSFQEKADFAFAVQKITNEAIIHAASFLKSITGSNNICIAGGVALNSAANYQLYKKYLFKNYFVQPASGDSGTSIGAALYGAYILTNL